MTLEEFKRWARDKVLEFEASRESGEDTADGWNAELIDFLMDEADRDNDEEEPADEPA